MEVETDQVESSEVAESTEGEVPSTLYEANERLQERLGNGDFVVDGVGDTQSEETEPTEDVKDSETTKNIESSGTAKETEGEALEIDPKGKYSIKGETYSGEEVITQKLFHKDYTKKRQLDSGVVAAVREEYANLQSVLRDPVQRNLYFQQQGIDLTDTGGVQGNEAPPEIVVDEFASPEEKANAEKINRVIGLQAKQINELTNQVQNQGHNLQRIGTNEEIVQRKKEYSAFRGLDGNEYLPEEKVSLPVANALVNYIRGNPVLAKQFPNYNIAHGMQDAIDASGVSAILKDPVKWIKKRAEYAGLEQEIIDNYLKGKKETVDKNKGFSSTTKKITKVVDKSQKPANNIAEGTERALKRAALLGLG